MKILKLTRMGIAALLTGAVMIGFTACETQPDTSKEIAEEQNEVTFDDKDAEDDADYLVEAALILQNSARLGELAATKATTNEVKGLGSTMAKAHTAELATLQSLATAKSISLPAAPMDNTKDAYDDLNEKKGLDFDKEYTDNVVSSHKDAIDKIESIEKNAQDPEIRAWATKLLPNLRSHLGSAESIQEIVKNKK